SSRRRHTIFSRDWSSDVCSSDLFIDKGSRLTQFKPNHFINYSLEPCWGCSECVPREKNKNIIKKPKLQKPNPKNQNIKRQNQIRSEERRVGKESRYQRRK